ncbi:MAG: SDR family NAD(P)-dependent oxidoreductase [Candidatus Babeliales bacterium]
MPQSFFKDLPILVTGGAGFIGSHIVEQLIENGAQVTVLDNFSTGCLENLKAVKSSVTIINGDINDFETCLKATQNAVIIFHLAALICVPESIENPEVYFQTNIIGTLNLLRAAKKNKVKRFVFSSSAAVYGPCDQPCIETMPCSPQSPYGHSKLIGEQLCKQFYATDNIESIILRYFNVYGPRQNPHSAYAGAVAKFRLNMLTNNPITIFGDGSQTRDFIPVQTVAQINLNLAQAPTPLVASSIFNVATGASQTLLELINQLKKEFPEFSAGYRLSPERPGDIKHSQANCIKLATMLKQIKTNHDNHRKI